MPTTSRLSRIINAGLTICLLVLFAACGSSGSNEPPDENDGNFPEPPGRPGTVQMDSTVTPQ